ncbi:hypothetical protein [Azospirillum doebereinerae]|uniref:DnaA N-terminal domain-containing protein n=1 Tax=Azospirillum doebereinerae TaxID=92933 RepID=A0A433IZK4_9PROT|nr:hypothetical protein [Azospirillum doebereinerae]RUQ61232.1 hypothetical protein EJ913_29940 [Azospirillum doebereinerae]
MARIRSCFPGQWTDEDFVECSPLARLLVIGLRNEADDQGVFEWKPRALKMRLLPADDINVTDLLGELATHRQVMPYEIDGKAYGAIRNFMLWQRPKKPKAIHPVTPEVRDWVGMNRRSPPVGSEPVEDRGSAGAELEGDEEAPGSEPVPNPTETNTTSTASGTVPVPHQSGTGTDFAVQREEVGGRREEDLSSRVGESSAGGSACEGAKDHTAAGLVLDFGVEAVDAVFVLVERGVENWFDVARCERSAGDGRVIRGWLASAEAAGMTAPDALELIGEVVDRQLKRLSEKPKQTAPFSLGMLTKDVEGAITAARRKPPHVADAPPAPMEERAPAPYDKRFTVVQWASWIKPCTVTVADGRAVIVAPASLTAARLRDHHGQDLRDCLGVADVEIQIAPRAKSAKGGGSKSAQVIQHPAMAGAK